MGKTFRWCDHKPVWVGRVAVCACADCGKVDWLSDLIGHLDALSGPTSTVLAYVPPNQKKRKNLDALPKQVWLEVGPRLWLSHDGEVLLLATDHQLLIENLTRGA
jgi:hypothetical protein